MAIITRQPVGELYSNGFSGSYLDIDEGVATPDGNAITTSVGSGSLYAFLLEQPPGTVNLGANLQTFKVSAKKSGGTVTMNVWIYFQGLGGGAIQSSIALTTSYQTFTVPWDLADYSWGGSNAIGMAIARSSTGGTNTLYVDAAEWIADYTPVISGQPLVKRFGGVPGMRLNRGIW